MSSFWIVSLIIYVVIAIAVSVFVPFRVGKGHDGHDEPDMCPKCNLRPAPAWMRVVAGLLWPLIVILFVGALLVSLATGVM